MLSKEATEFIRKQRLGYIATVNPDNTPNLSPKGTFNVWDKEHLIFADINSPDTIRNLLVNPNAEINFVDIFKRKGFLIQGICKIISDERQMGECQLFYEKLGYAGYVDVIKHYVIIEIKELKELYSPAYDKGETAHSLEKYYRKYYRE